MKTVKKPRKSSTVKAKKPIKARTKLAKAKSSIKTISKKISKKSTPKKPLARIFIFKRVFYIPVLAVLLLSAVFVPTISKDIADFHHERAVLGTSEGNPHVCYSIGSTAPSTIYNLPEKVKATSTSTTSFDITFDIGPRGTSTTKNCNNTYASYYTVQWNMIGPEDKWFSGSYLHSATFPKDASYANSSQMSSYYTGVFTFFVTHYEWATEHVTIHLKNGATLNDVKNDIYNDVTHNFLGTVTAYNYEDKVFAPKHTVNVKVWFRIRSAKYYDCLKIATSTTSTNTITKCKTTYKYSPKVFAIQPKS